MRSSSATRSTSVSSAIRSPRYMASTGRISWYTGPRPKDPCWPKLAQMLLDEGFSDHNIQLLDESTTQDRRSARAPGDRRFTTKGLVLGHVQSGKTTNYTGVMAKAADRGYRLVIVLSGIHNELRRQTQNRLVNAARRPQPGHCGTS